MKQTTIDTTLLPNMWITWNTTKETFWLECKTGAKRNSKPDIEFGWQNYENKYIHAGSKLKWTYMKYHSDIDMLEIALAIMPSHRKAEVHEWQYAGNKYFIDKSKNVYNADGNITSHFSLHAGNYCYNQSNMLNSLSQHPFHPNVLDEFKKFIGANYYTIGNGRSIDIKGTWQVQDWYNKKQRATPLAKGREGKLVDKLTAIPLSDPSGFAEKYPAIVNEYLYGREYLDDIIYFERVNEEWSVLRIFHRYSNNELKETERLYLSDKGTSRICCPNKDGWVPSQRFKEWRNYYQFVNKEDAIEKCNRIKYLMPLIDHKERYASMKTLLMTLTRMPELEQLAKLGYKDIALAIANSTYPKAEFKARFGGYCNDKETNLLRKVGMTKYQLDKHLRSLNYNYGSCRELHHMRKFFGNDLSHIDNATFDKYFIAFGKMNQAWGLPGLIDNLDVDYNRFIKNLVRLGGKNENAYNLMRDTINMYNGLNMGTHPEVDWYFDDYSDMARMHDAIMALKLEQDAERRARWNISEAERRKKDEEKRIEIDEKRKEFEYEDDKYIIRLPRNGTEITNEGIMQHICIGGYVGSHSRGETNLFFLRDKERPDAPFYAIEMNNAKRIVQIHGSCNKWLGNDPDAIPTVIRWLRKNGISCTDEILTCTSQGYSSNRQYVAMPVVD